MTINSDGIVLVAGPFSGDLKLSDSIDLNSPSETNFVAAFDGSTGAPLWATQLDLGPGGFVLGAAADPHDKGLVIAATATAAVSFGSFSGAAGGGKDLFVARLSGDTKGTLL